jgi:hypothetical protein
MLFLAGTTRLIVMASHWSTMHSRNFVFVMLLYYLDTVWYYFRDNYGGRERDREKCLQQQQTANKWNTTNYLWNLVVKLLDISRWTFFITMPMNCGNIYVFSWSFDLFSNKHQFFVQIFLFLLVKFKIKFKLSSKFSAKIFFIVTSE